MPGDDVVHRSIRSCSYFHICPSSPRPLHTFNNSPSVGAATDLLSSRVDEIVAANDGKGDVFLHEGNPTQGESASQQGQRQYHVTHHPTTPPTSNSTIISRSSGYADGPPRMERLKLTFSSGVRVSALAMTGITFTLAERVWRARMSSSLRLQVGHWNVRKAGNGKVRRRNLGGKYRRRDREQSDEDNTGRDEVKQRVHPGIRDRATELGTALSIVVGLELFINVFDDGFKAAVVEKSVAGRCSNLLGATVQAITKSGGIDHAKVERHAILDQLYTNTNTNR
ncbi:hypothetical protein BC938DRAFT_475697 [Jimgerdemannia flammicorona]|uniref:Uncharacterized protein n=1 Tax=Jimgerdemannia flammicorona TaxID=994334 RepID=A0A433QRC7_9FUNG|nr:hypothetical protein BC938DRAFT_475697 [Jimgerdemannia flammicorona]